MSSVPRRKSSPTTEKVAVVWESRWLSTRQVTTISKASEILKGVLYDTNRRREVRQFLVSMGGFRTPQFWKTLDDIYSRLAHGGLPGERKDRCLRAGKTGRISFLAEKFENLREGETLELAEPTRETLGEQNVWTRQLTQMLIESVLKAAEVSEFEVAFLVYYEWCLRDEDQFPTLSEREFSDLALESGFQIITRITSHHGLRTHWHLRKPIPPITH